MLTMISNLNNDIEIIKIYFEYKELIIIGSICGLIYGIEKIVKAISNIVKIVTLIIKYGVAETQYLIKNKKRVKKDKIVIGILILIITIFMIS